MNRHRRTARTAAQSRRVSTPVVAFDPADAPLLANSGFEQHAALHAIVEGTLRVCRRHVPRLRRHLNSAALANRVWGLGRTSDAFWQAKYSASSGTRIVRSLPAGAGIGAVATHVASRRRAAVTQPGWSTRVVRIATFAARPCSRSVTTPGLQRRRSRPLGFLVNSHPVALKTSAARPNG